jgi:hypothetical protein
MRDYFLVCLSPVIPGCYTFFDFCEMFTVRHGASLSLALIISCRGEDGKISGHRVIGRSENRLQPFFHHKSYVQAVTDIEPTIRDNGDDL